MPPSVDRILRHHWLLVAIAAVAGFFRDRATLWGVVAGGAVIGLSTLVYVVVFRATVLQGRRRLAFGMLFVKFLAFLGLGWLVFAASEAYRPDPLGFMVGVTCMPVAAVWEAMRARKD
jgi:hypothetical protein